MKKSILKLSLSKLCAVHFDLQNRAHCEGGEKGEKVRTPEERAGRGVASKGGKKGKKDA